MSSGEIETSSVHLKDQKVVGNGSFGVVYQATLVETGENVAVKKVLQDKRFKVSALETTNNPCKLHEGILPFFFECMGWFFEPWGYFGRPDLLPHGFAVPDCLYMLGDRSMSTVAVADCMDLS
jgi:hypothetical protein